MKITVSLIKADIGGWVGHSTVHPKQIELANKKLAEAKETGLIIDYYVFHCGDDLELLMTHTKGESNPEIHKLAWDTFVEVTDKVSKPLKLYGAGQDLLSEAFSGNVRGMGPGVAEMEFEERKSEPILVFAADKTAPSAWNMPLYKMFADPFNTAGLVIDPNMHGGFKFEVMDTIEGKVVVMNTPEEIYDLLALIGSYERYVIRRVWRKKDDLIAAAASVTRLNLIAGKYVGKDDPVLLVRAQHGLPAVGEILEAFAFPHVVEGWMRGSHNGPLMPVPLRFAKCTRFDGPPRVVGLGFQIHDGILEGPNDLFDDPAYDYTRFLAQLVADYVRRHGPFEPHRLPMEEMEYTTLPGVLEKLKDRFAPAD